MKKRKKPKYSMLIEWSPADKLYLVALPEWTAVNDPGHQKYYTHGKTYEKAAKHGREVLELFVEAAEAGEIHMAIPKFANYEDDKENT